MDKETKIKKFLAEMSRRHIRFYEYIESHPAEKKLFEDKISGRKNFFREEMYFCERMMKESREPSSELWEYVFEGELVDHPMRKKCLYAQIVSAYLLLIETESDKAAREQIEKEYKELNKGETNNE